MMARRFGGRWVAAFTGENKFNWIYFYRAMRCRLFAHRSRQWLACVVSTVKCTHTCAPANDRRWRVDRPIGVANGDRCSCMRVRAGIFFIRFKKNIQSSRSNTKIFAIFLFCIPLNVRKKRAISRRKCAKSGRAFLFAYFGQPSVLPVLAHAVARTHTHSDDGPNATRMAMVNCHVCNTHSHTHSHILYRYYIKCYCTQIKYRRLHSAPSKWAKQKSL